MRKRLASEGINQTTVLAQRPLAINHMKRFVLLLLLACSGCTFVSYNRVFPKLTWYWSDDAKGQRAAKAYREQAEQMYKTNSPAR